MSEKIIVAMSGGVDSSATAALLKEEGLDLVGITMRVWETPDNIVDGRKACCTVDDAIDAKRVADRLQIPHYTLNVKAAFKEKVVDVFVSEYLAGRTPNPCVLCNQDIKFDYLFKQGEKFGATKVATGHYARIGEFEGGPALMRGSDHLKDQSYFLFSTPKERLGSILFPLHDLSKEKTRALAKKHGLNVAEKSESQEICFVPDNDYASLVADQSGATIGEGEIVDINGKVIGRHKGYIHYTVGQRKGLGISHPTPLYVLRIESASNRIVVTDKEAIFGHSLVAKNFNWFVAPERAQNLPNITARIRHNSPDSPATISVSEDDSVTVKFESPQLAITPGQAVVIYYGDVVIGGGWIERRLD